MACIGTGEFCLNFGVSRSTKGAPAPWLVLESPRKTRDAYTKFLGQNTENTSMTMVVNFSKQQYLLPDVFGEKADLHSVLSGWDGVKTALACLLADGNNRGGGDLRTDDPIVGSWAGCQIGLVSDTDLVPEKSLPGLEHIPLAQQYREIGKDISAEIYNALCDGDGEYFTPYFLRNDCVLTPVEQRSRFQDSEDFFKVFHADSAIEDVSHVWTLLGASFRISPKAALRSLQEALDAQRKNLGVSNAVIAEMVIGPWGRTKRPDEVREPTGLQSLLLTLEVDGRRNVHHFQFSDTPSHIFKALTGCDLFKPKAARDVLILDSEMAAKAFVANLLKGAQ